MTLRFTTDSSISGRGFRIDFSTRGATCGGSVTNVESYSIASPGYPNAYRVPSTGVLDCNYLISMPHAQVAQLELQDLQLPASVNCSDNSLSIFSGSGRRRQLSRRLCTMPAVVAERTFVSQAERTLVSLTAKQAGKGFKMQETAVCGGRRVATASVQTLHPTSLMAP